MPSWWRPSTWRHEIRTRVWPVPVAALVAALALGVGLPWLDAALGDRLSGSVTVWLFGGGAGAARTLLSALATSLITVTSLTFSLTVVTLQLASSQYSPRLLRTFSRDRFVHYTLALFLGSFVYALTVLRTVRSPEEGGQDAFVPQLSVTVAFVLAVASVLGLVLFLAHLAREIRVETIMRNVHQDATSTIEQVLPEEGGTTTASPSTPPADQASTLSAPSSGFLVGIDADRLLEAARAADALVVVDRVAGDAIVEGTPVARGWPIVGGRLSSEQASTLEEGLRAALATGFERTGQEDVGFGLRQLTDVAVKALSPGINDPTTAVHALNHVAAVLRELLRRKLQPVVLSDDERRPRVVLRQRSFPELLDVAVSQPRIYGGDDPGVARALFELLHSMAWVAEDREDVAAVEDQLARLRDTIQRGPLDSVHQKEMAALDEWVTAACRTRPATGT